MPSESLPRIVIAHDYLCPWCWIGLFQAKKLQQEFPTITLDWQSYELLPEELGPLPSAIIPYSERFLALANAENIPLRTRRGYVRTHNALEGAEFIKATAPQAFEQYNEYVYQALWEQGQDISDIEVLSPIAALVGVDVEEFIAAVTNKKFYQLIIRFDDDAHAHGVAYVPTFMIRGEQCAEASYATIREMTERMIARQ